MQRRTGVEAKPAQPQQRSTQDDVGNVARFRLLVLATAQEDGTHQRCDAGRGVYHDATGEVLYVHAGKETVGVPGPVRQRAIHEDAEQDHEYRVGRKAYAFGK